MSKKICAIGCPPGNNLYRFPSREKDGERRKLWLDYFDMEEPNIKEVFACDRHFSQFQATPKGIRRDAIPDVPVIFNTSSPFRRKRKNWRPNVNVITPRDPEYIIYRKQTGIFFQHHNNISDKPANLQHNHQTIQMPLIKSVSCSTTTQTNTRICGLVQISEFVDIYRLNCFYCSEIFLLEKWSDFVEHLKAQHYTEEEAFKKFKYISDEHDYTPIGLSSSKEEKKPKIYVKTDLIAKPPTAPQLLVEASQAPPQTEMNVTIDSVKEVPVIVLDSDPPQPVEPTLKPANDTAEKQPFNITLADKLIKLLDETLLNPNFRNTEKQNTNMVANNIENSTNFIEIKNASLPTAQSRKLKCTATKFTRPVYSLSGGQQNIATRRNSFVNVNKKRKITLRKNESTTKVLVKDEPSTSTQNSNKENSKPIKKGTVQQSSKNVKTFESIYKTLKSKPKVISSGIFYLKDIVGDKLPKRQTSTKTALSRCLKRTNTEIISPEDKEDYKPFTIQSLQLKPTELVYEYTPRVIIDLFLESMKMYPVLWEFHYEPFNEDYRKAIDQLCQIIQVKWLINIDAIKMCRSINRILKHYRYIRFGTSTNKFLQYFEKCCQFLPSSADNVPQARCYLCFVCYKNDIDLRHHLIKNHDALQWPFKCRDCKERFQQTDEYELHKHLPHYDEFFSCHLCNKKFSRYYLYKKHLELHKSVQINESGKYPCSICNKEFKTSGELHSHQIYHGEKKHKCPICSKGFFKNTALKFHLKRHRKEHDVICEVCGKGFIHQAYLNAHMDKHTNATVTCNICNLKLRHASLVRHLRTVHVACEGTIESTFRAKNHNYKSLLGAVIKPNRRLRKKPEEKLSRRYICKICDIYFDRLKFLKDHNKDLHSDIEKWPCKMCNSVFGKKHSLKRHCRVKHKLHAYQVYKLVDQNEDVNVVLAIKSEELKKMESTLAYSLTGPSYGKKKSQTANEATVIIKTDPMPGEMDFDEERIQSPTIADEIMEAVDNISTNDIKVDDDDPAMNDFFKDLLSQT